MVAIGGVDTPDGKDTGHPRRRIRLADTGTSITSSTTMITGIARRLPESFQQCSPDPSRQFWPLQLFFACLFRMGGREVTGADEIVMRPNTTATANTAVDIAVQTGHQGALDAVGRGSHDDGVIELLQDFRESIQVVFLDVHPVCSCLHGNRHEVTGTDHAKRGVATSIAWRRRRPGRRGIDFSLLSLFRGKPDELFRQDACAFQDSAVVFAVAVVAFVVLTAGRRWQRQADTHQIHAVGRHGRPNGLQGVSCLLLRVAGIAFRNDGQEGPVRWEVVLVGGDAIVVYKGSSCSERSSRRIVCLLT